jgi:hypothetical protein
MLFPLVICFLVFARLSRRDSLFWTVLSNAAANGKRRRTLDRQVIERTGLFGEISPGISRGISL